MYSILKQEILSAFVENHGFTRGAPSYQEKSFSVKSVFAALSATAAKEQQIIEKRNLENCMIICEK
jgi:hypothetical protein